MKTHSESSAAGCMMRVAQSVASVVKYAERAAQDPNDPENFQKMFYAVAENTLANSKAIAAMYQTQVMSAMVVGESGPLASDMEPLTVESVEPPTGSIILLHGETGTAVQSHFNDGLYHSSTGKTYSYEALFAVNPTRPPLLVYRAPVEG